MKLKGISIMSCNVKGSEWKVQLHIESMQLKIQKVVHYANVCVCNSHEHSIVTVIGNPPTRYQCTS